MVYLCFLAFLIKNKARVIYNETRVKETLEIITVAQKKLI